MKQYNKYYIKLIVAIIVIDMGELSGMNINLR